MAADTGKTCLVRINGDSMWPTLRDGDEVECDLSAYSDSLPVVGDVVLSVHPLRSSVRVVKRVGEISSLGRFFLQGDNPDPLSTTDSHTFGPVAIELILGRIDLTNHD